MQFTVQRGKPSQQTTDCLIVGVYEDGHFTPSAKHIDKISKGFLTRAMKRDDFNGKMGQALLLHDIPQLAATRLLVIGCGKESDLKDHGFRKLVNRAIYVIHNTGSRNALSYLGELAVKKHDDYWKVRQSIEGAADVVYSFNEFKNKDKVRPVKLTKLDFGFTTEINKKEIMQAIKDGTAIINSMQYVKDLGNSPANVCTPTYLAKQAQQLAKQYKSLKVRILEMSEIKKLGMGAIVAVAKGSHEPPKFIVVHYQGSKKTAKPIALVGKGVTFDTGGISLKPPPNMDEMKYDMCGAATVLGTIKAAAELQLPINIVGVIAAVENMPGGGATRPGDIVKTLSGQTVEILNTDAEGRLILCDALTYTERFNPSLVIDIATLTGAIVVALGHLATGLFSNHEPLTQALQKASDFSADRIWHMPMWEEYGEGLSSNFADIANVGPREGGSCIAAYYLSRFTANFHWAHLDCAGVAWKSGREKGATGRPVPLLVQFLLDQC